jgi:hypothetical protein
MCAAAGAGPHAPDVSVSSSRPCSAHVAVGHGSSGGGDGSDTATAAPPGLHPICITSPFAAADAAAPAGDHAHPQQRHAGSASAVLHSRSSAAVTATSLQSAHQVVMGALQSQQSRIPLPPCLRQPPHQRLEQQQEQGPDGTGCVDATDDAVAGAEAEQDGASC